MNKIKEIETSAGHILEVVDTIMKNGSTAFVVRKTGGTPEEENYPYIIDQTLVHQVTKIETEEDVFSKISEMMQGLYTQIMQQMKSEMDQFKNGIQDRFKDDDQIN